MNMPGFTAEASLGQTDDRYEPVLDTNRLENQRGITPQLPRVLNCFCFRSGRYCCCRGDDGKLVCGATLQA